LIQFSAVFHEIQRYADFRCEGRNIYPSDQGADNSLIKLFKAVKAPEMR
jgi:hypothetical protein